MTKSTGFGKINRRTFTAGGSAIGALALAAPAVLIPGRAKSQNGRVVVANWGGSASDAQQKAFFEPFTRETGIEVFIAGAPDLARIRSQVQANAVEIDVVELVGAWVTPGENEGLWEPIDDSIVDRSAVLSEVMREQQLGYFLYGGGIGFDATRHAPEEVPENWADFWNVEKFPGRRGLRNRVSEMLEIALMADGVPGREMYPLDVDRAFASLDRVKPHVQNWITQTPQTISLIQNRELDFTYTYNLRAFSAGLGFQAKQNFVGVNWAAVVKGTPNRENAMRLLSYYVRPDCLATFCNTVGTTPVVKGIEELIDDAVRPYLIDVGNTEHCFENLAWWSDKQEPLQERFQEWLLG